jgi:hypothetical protein
LNLPGFNILTLSFKPVLLSSILHEAEGQTLEHLLRLKQELTLLIASAGEEEKRLCTIFSKETVFVRTGYISTSDVKRWVSLGIVYWQKLPRVEVVAGTQHRHVEQ